MSHDYQDFDNLTPMDLYQQGRLAYDAEQDIYYDVETGAWVDVEDESFLNIQSNMFLPQAKSIEWNEGFFPNRDKKVPYVYIKAILHDGERAVFEFPQVYAESSLFENALRTIKEIGTRVKGKYGGTLVTNRRQLTSKFITMGLMPQTSYSTYYAQAFKVEPYQEKLSEYFSYELLNYKEIQNYELKPAVNTMYWQQKSEDLRKLASNESWRLVGIEDTIFGGKCTLGHKLRYKYIVESYPSKERIEFGVSCLGDFFEVTDNIKNDLKRFVRTLQTLQGDYIHAYCALESGYPRYENRKNNDRLFYEVSKHLNIKDESMHGRLEWLKFFVDNGLPIPKPLAYVIIQKNIKRYYEVNTGNTKFPLNNTITYIGLMGNNYTDYADLENAVKINGYGDRIMPKVVSAISSTNLRYDFGHSRNVERTLTDEELEQAIAVLESGNWLNYTNLLKEHGFYDIEYSPKYKELDFPKVELSKLLKVLKEKSLDTEKAHSFVDAVIKNYGFDIINEAKKRVSQYPMKLGKDTSYGALVDLKYHILSNSNSLFIKNYKDILCKDLNFDALLELLSLRGYSKDEGSPELNKLLVYEDKIRKLTEDAMNVINEEKDKEQMYDDFSYIISYIDYLYKVLGDYNGDIAINSQLSYKISSTVSRYKKLSDKQLGVWISTFNKVKESVSGIEQAKTLEEFVNESSFDLSIVEKRKEMLVSKGYTWTD